MHLFLSSFVTFLLSFGHAQTLRHTEARAFATPSAETSGFDYAIPSHREILAEQSGAGSYAVSACPGCRPTIPSSPAR